jgi:hypothetical protein
MDEAKEPLPPRGRGNIERKQELDKNKEINCGRCPINRGENAYGKRRPIQDKKPKLTCPECKYGKILSPKGRGRTAGRCSHCKKWVSTKPIQRRKWVIYI